MEIFGANVPVWVLLSLIVMLLVYVFLTWNYDTFKKMGVPGPKPYPLVGTMLPLFTKVSDIKRFDRDLVDKYGNFIGLYEGSRPVLLVSDPECLKQICVKDFPTFTDRVQLIDESLFVEPFDKLMTVLKGNRWKHVRNLCSPTFTSGKLKKMIPVVNICADQLVENLEELAKKKEDVIMKDRGGNFALDVIARTAFGLELNTQKEKDNPFVKMAEKMTTPSQLLSFIIFLVPWLAVPLYKLFGINAIAVAPGKFFSQIIRQALEEKRTRNDNTNTDFLQLMLKAHEDKPTEEEKAEENLFNSSQDTNGDISTSKGLTEAEIISQALIFLFAGHGTVSDAISWMCYELAINPEVQDKLIEEVDDVTGGAKLTSEMVNKLEYVEMCLYETLRKYPAFRLNREVGEDVNIGGINVPKGMRVDMAVAAIHYDPKIYPDPYKFKPERFTADEKNARNPYAFIPFGHGPRNCIGMRLALLEIKLAIARIAQKMKFVQCDKTEIPVKMKVLLPANPIRIRAQFR